VASAATTALAIASADVFALLPVPVASVRSAFALLGVAAFAASLVQMRLDWGGRALLFAGAADTCAQLKQRLREATAATDQSQPGRREDVLREYRVVTATLPRIPERDFVRLKAAHRQKVALSRQVEQQPFTPLWYLRWRAMLNEHRRSD